MGCPAYYGLIQVDISVSYLEVEAAVRIYTDPSLKVHGSPLTPVIREGHEDPNLTLKAPRKVKILHDPPPLILFLSPVFRVFFAPFNIMEKGLHFNTTS